MIRLHLLGRVELRLSDGTEPRALLSQPKPMALVAYLAAASPVGYRRRDELLAVFWPELDSARGRRALSQALHVIRSSLEEGAISTRGVEELGINPEVVLSDIAEFRTAVSEEHWETASLLYQGELLAGFFIPGSTEFDQWVDRERSTLRSQAADSAWHLSESAESAGNPDGARDWGRRAMEMEPYGEEGLRRFMRLLERTGNPAQAIRTFDDYRARIARELDLEPAAETRELAETLRTKQVPTAKPPRKTAALDGGTNAPAVEAVSDGAGFRPLTGPSTNSKSPRRLLFVALPVIAILAAAAFFRWTRPDSNAAPPESRVATNRIIVADFTSDPSDSALARTVTEAIKLDLSGSHLIEVVSETKARDALTLMRRDTGTRMNPDIAREIAIREGVKAVLQGNVRRTGSVIALTARLVGADKAELTGGWRSTAKDSTEIVQAINTLSSAVRRDAGESIKAISESSPLLHVSTTSLLALRKHAMGMAAYYDEDFRRANSLFEEAIGIDSTFVDAYMMLAVSLMQLGVQPSRQVEATAKAYRYRDRLGDAERYNVEANYLADVKGDIPGAIAAAFNAAAIDSGIVFWGKVASQLTRQRRYSEAEGVAIKGLRWTPNPFLHRILANVQFRERKFDEAQRTMDAAAKLFPNSMQFPAQRIDFAEATGAYDIADSLAHALPHARGNTLPLLYEGLTDALTGKVSEAKSHLRDLQRVQLSGSVWDASIRTTVLLARIDLELLNDTATALAVLDSGVARSHWKEIDPRDRPYLTLAHFFLEAGRPRRAAPLIDEYERNVPLDFRARSQSLRLRTRAMLRVANGDSSGVDAIALAVETEPAPVTALADLVWSYRKLNQREAAEKAANSYLSELNPQRLEDDAFNIAKMLELLEASAASNGGTQEAAKYKALVNRLWRDADPVLRKRLQ